MKKLELFYPLKNFSISQGFGGNANDFYKTHNLMGHTGIDMVSCYNDPVELAQDGNVYKIINRDNPDFSKFRAVFEIVDTDTGTYEICYGHCNTMIESKGDFTTGTVIATEGNTGDVYVNGVTVTADERAKGSKAGTHLHFQVREIQKTLSPIFDTKNQFLSGEDGYPYRDKDGYYFLIPNYDNGLNGCINPEPFFNRLNADIVNQVGILILAVQKFISLFKK